jgi:integrase
LGCLAFGRGEEAMRRGHACSFWPGAAVRPDLRMLCHGRRPHPHQGHGGWQAAMAEPKTAKGRRSLTLAPEVVDTLRAHCARQVAERLSWGADYTDSGLVTATEDGRPFHPETLSGLFVRHAKRAGLPPIRLHDLRHSVASILLARGVHPKVVSEMLGHAIIALTWIPTATSSRRSSRKRRVSLSPPSSILPQRRLKRPRRGKSGPSRSVVDRK